MYIKIHIKDFLLYTYTHEDLSSLLYVFIYFIFNGYKYMEWLFHSLHTTTYISPLLYP